jgi:hypothetical protein
MIEVLKQMVDALKLSAISIDNFSVQKKSQEAIQAGRQAIAELESQDHIEQHLIWANQLSAAQRNELSQIENGTWEADRNG